MFKKSIRRCIKKKNSSSAGTIIAFIFLQTSSPHPSRGYDQEKARFYFDLLPSGRTDKELLPLGVKKSRSEKELIASGMKKARAKKLKPL